MDALTATQMRITQMRAEAYGGAAPAAPAAVAPSARELRARSIAAQVEVELAHRTAVRSVTEAMGDVAATSRRLAIADEILLARGMSGASPTTLLTMLGGPGGGADQAADAARTFGRGTTLAVAAGALAIGAATALVLHRNDE